LVDLAPAEKLIMTFEGVVLFFGYCASALVFATFFMRSVIGSLLKATWATRSTSS
jgi:hypothetical protein